MKHALSSAIFLGIFACVIISVHGLGAADIQSLRNIAAAYPALQMLPVPWTATNVSSLPCGPPSWTGLTCIPAALPDPEILEIELTDIALRGPFLSNLTTLNIWRRIHLVRCDIAGTIPQAIYSLQYLSSLDITSNLISGTIDPLISRLTRLTSLTADHNGLSGSLPPSITQLNLLTTLSIANNTLNGTIPENIGNMTQLRTLRLALNGAMTGTIPQSLGRSVSLVTLDLESMNLQGRIPSSLCNLTLLETFNIAYSNLNGTFAPCFSNLNRIVNFHARQNRLEGDLPGFLRTSVGLRFFLVQSNLFNGTIPPIPPGSQLRRLILHTNRLRGNVPTSISNAAANLVAFNIQNNRLSGPFPSAAVASLPRLADFDASLNNFTGCFRSNVNVNMTTCILRNNTNLCSCPTTLPCDTRCAVCSTLTCSLVAVAPPPQCANGANCVSNVTIGGGSGSSTVSFTNPTIILGDFVVSDNNATVSLSVGSSGVPLQIQGCAQYAGNLRINITGASLSPNLTLATLAGCAETPDSRFAGVQVQGPDCKEYSAPELEYSAVSLNLLLGAADESKCSGNSAAGGNSGLSVGALAGIITAAVVLGVVGFIFLVYVFRARLIPVWRAHAESKRNAGKLSSGW